MRGSDLEPNAFTPVSVAMRGLTVTPQPTDTANHMPHFSVRHALPLTRCVRERHALDASMTLTQLGGFPHREALQ